MSLIFLSYRRADAQDLAGRLYDKLCTRYRAEDVFFDVDAIPYGVHFPSFIEQEIQDCAVVLALIGERWLTGGEQDNRLLGSAEDFVRVELEIALRHERTIIPLLVNDARMPTKEDLPESIAEFAYLNAAPIDSGAGFHAATDRLLARVDALVGERPAAAPTPVSGALELVSGPQPRQRFALSADRTEIGRLPDSDVTLADSSVSRRHALVERVGAGYCVVDSGSVNGVVVNGTRVVAPCALADGDLIQIGVFVLKYLQSS